MHKPSFERALRWTSSALYRMDGDLLRIMREQGLEINVRYKIWDHVGASVTRDVEGLVSGVAESVQLDPMGMIVARMSNEVYFIVQAEIREPIHSACADKFHA